MLLLELDGFKQVHDSFDHDAGDRLLIEVAAPLKDCVREDDTVARLGGGEFTVIFAGVRQRQDIEFVAHSIISPLAMPFPIAEQSVQISAGIGCALLAEYASSLEDLLRAADQAMFRARNSAIDRLFFFFGSIEQVVNSTH